MDALLLAFGFSLALISAIFIAVNPQYRNDILRRLGLQKTRTTEIITPPKSLSPEKQGLPNSNAPPSPPTYGDVFPPHRRKALADLSPNALSAPGRSAQEASQQPPAYSMLTPDKHVCDSDDMRNHTTATGFTVEEIKRLGDFPDYATLSGVPLPQAYKEFDIKTAKPRPYRPLRWAYHQTMSLMKLETDWWLELHSTYAKVIKQRQQLYDEYGDSTLRALPGSEIATKELMEIALQFLCARYPQYFELDKSNMVFHNHILDTKTDLRTTSPLFVLLYNIPEDFAIMIRDPETGIYSFRAGIIMSSLGWNLGTKIGKKLHEIHGPVPDYREKMQFSMDRFFAKMPTDKPIQRGSWGLEIDEPLYAPPGPLTDALTAEPAEGESHTIDRVHFRVDWQTLRRLPLSGAIVFNFKGLFTPVTEFRTEPYIPSLILKVGKEGKENLKEYKHLSHTERVVREAMEAYEREQIENGLIEKGWEERTLAESPFFPGWEKKWHEQQGF